ncbi:hypothetical protein B566_EDAN013268, partial [Ephemera danica]
MYNIANVEFLTLSNNHLKAVPVGLELLKKLKYLDLSFQYWYSFQLNFGNKTNIEVLALDGLAIKKLDSYCQIAYIEENTFHGLTDLLLLDLSNNKNLKQIFSDTFLHLASLAKVFIRNNPLLNNSIGALKFKNILTLDLSNCSLTSFPGTISVIGIIENLNLYSNAINKLESGNFNFKIKNLNLSHNRFETMNSEMGDILSKLQ